MNFAEKMIELRRQQNLSQQDLADRLGVSRQAISRWETGAVQPTADSVRGLAQVLQVSTDYLLNDELDDPTPPRSPQPEPTPQEEPKARPQAQEMAPGSGCPGGSRPACAGHGGRHGVLSPVERTSAGVCVGCVVGTG